MFLLFLTLEGVWCGQHSASDCSDCNFGKTVESEHCNGTCQWINETCVHRGKYVETISRCLVILIGSEHHKVPFVAENTAIILLANTYPIHEPFSADR